MINLKINNVDVETCENSIETVQIIINGIVYYDYKVSPCEDDNNDICIGITAEDLK